jgi:hypothetical protein
VERRKKDRVNKIDSDCQEFNINHYTDDFLPAYLIITFSFQTDDGLIVDNVTWGKKTKKSIS